MQTGYRARVNLALSRSRTSDRVRVYDGNVDGHLDRAGGQGSSRPTKTTGRVGRPDGLSVTPHFRRRSRKLVDAARGARDGRAGDRTRGSEALGAGLSRSIRSTGGARRLARVARVAIVGSYGVGLTVELDRVPDAGETVVGRTFRRDHGGKGSNQAVGAARLGAEVDFLTAIGDDAFGHDAIALWEAEGVHAEAVLAPPAATMTAPIFVEPSGQNRIVIVPGALERLDTRARRRVRRADRARGRLPRAARDPGRHGALRARGRAPRRRADDPQPGACAARADRAARSTT